MRAHEFILPVTENKVPALPVIVQPKQSKVSKTSNKKKIEELSKEINR